MSSELAFVTASLTFFILRFFEVVWQVMNLSPHFHFKVRHW
jgi:hypothetical protein